MYFFSLVPYYKCPLLTVVVLPEILQQLGNGRLGWAEAAALKTDHVTGSFPAFPRLLCREALPRKADCPGAWSSRLYLPESNLQGAAGLQRPQVKELQPSVQAESHHHRFPEAHDP